MATEAIFYCRGRDLDNSQDYNEDKLVQWLHNNMGIMRKIENKRKPMTNNVNISQERLYISKIIGGSTQYNALNHSY